MADTSLLHMWRALQADGELNLEVTYKPFEDDEQDSGYREAEAFALLRQQQNITDVKVGPCRVAHLPSWCPLCRLEHPLATLARSCMSLSTTLCRHPLTGESSCSPPEVDALSPSRGRPS